MASELSLTFSLSFSKSSSSITAVESDSIDVAGTKYVKINQSIPTSDTSLTLGSVGTIGYVWLKNTDSTNYVEFGSDGSVWPIKLKAGEICLVRWNAAAVHAKANTSACIIEYIIIDT